MGLLLAAAGIVLFLIWRRRRRSAASSFVDLAELRQMGWNEYSVLIADYFVREGFLVREQPTGGVDFDLVKGEQRYLAQCSQWRSRKVDENAVRELYQIMAARNAAGGYILTCGEFTPAAVKFASGKRIELINGADLRQMVEEVQQADSELTAPRAQVRDDEATAPRRVILCPRCGRSMTRRTDRVSGRDYYGCSRYPSCRGRREIA